MRGRGERIPAGLDLWDLSPLAAARDAVKKEALRRAGVAYIGIRPDDNPDDVGREMLRLARREPPKPPQPTTLADASP